jgi:hypothetical protein
MLDEVKDNVLVKEANKMAKQHEKKLADQKKQESKMADTETVDAADDKMTDENDVEKRPRRHTKKQRNKPY